MQQNQEEQPVSVEEALKPVPISPEESAKLNNFLNRVCNTLRTE